MKKHLFKLFIFLLLSSQVLLAEEEKSTTENEDDELRPSRRFVSSVSLENKMRSDLVSPGATRREQCMCAMSIITIES